MSNITVDKVWFTDDAVWIRTEDGREAKELLADYPRLGYARREQLEDYTIDSVGIHWAQLDEDLCFESFFEEKQHNALYRFFANHPEINAAAIARRIGISQSVFAQYITGTLKPGQAVLDKIKNEIIGIGRDLQVVSI